MESNKYQFPENIKIEDKDFTLVKIQRDGITAIYKENDIFLRIGDEERISRDLETHKEMLAIGFPIAQILSEGHTQNYKYFIETSLGDENFSSIFTKEINEIGKISDKSFNNFLSLTNKLGEAQLKTISDDKDFIKFSKDIHLDMLLDELPRYAENIQSRFDKAVGRLSELPFVLTHGDFNPFNTHQKGIIDLENSSWAPFGYDIISAIGTNEYFPFVKDIHANNFEFISGYKFSEDQKGTYLGLFDTQLAKLNLSPLSTYLEDLMFTRAIWLLVRMHKWPKIQRYRYDKFIREYLN
jgi:hypothetical protein